MGNRITIDENEWEKLKKDVNSLKERSEYKSNSILPLKTDLEEKEREVLEYIKNNPSVNKDQVVKHFEGTPCLSRVPVFKIIKSLIKRGYLIEQRNENNRHTRSLAVNQKSILLSVSEEMDCFKKHFFVLQDRVKQKLQETKRNQRVIREKKKREILSSMGHIYQKFVSIYMFRAILAWTNKIHDKQTLHELYSIVLSNIMEIQLKYSEFGNTESVSLASIPYNKDICTDDDYENEIQAFRDNDLEKEFMPTLETLDGINYKYGKYNRLEQYFEYQ
jgi:DNA-binding MarR family transcriptional regulator